MQTSIIVGGFFDGIVVWDQSSSHPRNIVLKIGLDKAQRRHVVRINGIAVPMTCTTFQTLCTLVVALWDEPSGRARLREMASIGERNKGSKEDMSLEGARTLASRLREPIGNVFGKPFARAFVALGGGDEYGLAIAKHDIEIDRRIFDYETYCCLNAKLQSSLKRICYELDASL